MTDQERFNELLNQLGDRKELADYIGLKLSSVNNQLASGDKVKKKLPAWAKSMLYMQERWQNKNDADAQSDFKSESEH